VTEAQEEAYNFFRQNGFMPVEWSHYSLLREYEDNTLLYDRTATIATMWAFACDGLYKIIDEYLCWVDFSWETVNFEIRRPSFVPGAPLSRIVDILYDFSQKIGLPELRVSTIEGRYLAEYQAIEGYTITSGYNDDVSDYVFRIDDLLDLSGKVHHDKRRRVRKYEKDPLVSFQSITKSNFSVCFEALDAWCNRKEGFTGADCNICGALPACGCIKTALKGMASIFNEQIYGGILAYYDGNPIGFAIWEKRKEKFAFVYYGQSAMPNFNKYLDYVLAKVYLSDMEYLNIGFDSGEEGIRLFKSQLGVHELLRKYFCTFTKESAGDNDD
jgi:hypothetical protein